MIINFKNPDYLASGSDAQRQIYDLLERNAVLQRLAPFNPIIVGTFPLNIQVPGSDLDIICNCGNTGLFTTYLNEHFGHYDGFQLRQLDNMEPSAVVAAFTIENQEFEIFGQPMPTDEQMGYMHMVAEHLMLCKYGETFRQEVIDLKKSGMKTEPAFCELLGITGDPYAGMLEPE